jgi:hypothetical protein
MSQTLIVTLFLLTIIACNNSQKNKFSQFVASNHLEKFDTICAISCLSCGGCIEGYVKMRTSLSNTIFIFDDECKSQFISKIKYSNHISISQSKLDSMFNNFGNIVLLAKKNDGYILIEKPTN